MSPRALLAALFLACATWSLHAQSPAPLPVPRGTGPIVVDGSLDDEAWKSAAVIDKFYETSPGDNIAAKVQTVAYITYDSNYFYIGIRADDPEPSRIRAPFVDRDGVIGTDDNIAIFLDTRNDKRSAIELRVNPRGVQADGIFNDANANEDFAPDFYYDTAAQIGSSGWTAEFRIPFSSLRYSTADPQTWNILVWRNYPREFRYAFHSAPLPRNSNCLICNTHPLVGLTNLPEAAHFIAAPYVTAQQLATPRSTYGSPLENQDLGTDAGLDVKWTPSANHAVDFTVNPDFSQIEADVPQVTVNERFAVFYPEKRPFFLEGFDLFDTPLTAAYTRTITSPRAGARATGKSGNTAYTLLVTNDRGGGLTIIPGPTGSSFAPQDFSSVSTIGRVRRDFGASFVGAVLTSRENDGGGHNRVFGPDGQWRPSETDVFTGQLLFSDTENPNRPDLSPAWNGASTRSHAFTASYDRQTHRYDTSARIRDIGEGFRADLGFVPQVGYREVLGTFGLRKFREQGTIRFWRPSIVVQRQFNRDNDTIYDLVSLGIGFSAVKNTQVGVLVRPREQILVGGRLLDQRHAIFEFQTDPARWLPRIGLTAVLGEQIDFANARVGDGGALTLTATVRPHDRLNLQLQGVREWLDAAGARVYTADVQRVRAQYSFSNKSLVRVIAQYVQNEFGNLYDGSFLGSVLYSYKLNWQTVLFVGYGDDRVLLEDKNLVPSGRSLFMKVSYALIR